MRRRDLLRLMMIGGAASAAPRLGWSLDGVGGRAKDGAPSIDPGASRFGHWTLRDDAPAFVYDADQSALAFAEWDPIIAPPTRRHWVMLGNQAIRLQAANDGRLALFDETEGLRWLTAPHEGGTGISLIDDGGARWGSDFAQRGGELVPERTFGPTWFEVRDTRAGVALERTVLCPEGDVPWVLIRVRLSLARGASARTVQHVEQWALTPRFLNLLELDSQRKTRAELAVTYDVTTVGRGVVATEVFAPTTAPGAVGAAAKFLIGAPATLALEGLARTPGTPRAVTNLGPFPTLEIETPVALKPGQTRELWFRFGRRDTHGVGNPRRVFTTSKRSVAKRLPSAATDHAAAAAHEIPWHAAMLTGGVASDRVIGGHSLDQASTYSYVLGFNGAARDPLQHALPLVYIAPALALSVLRNTCAWAKPDGDLPYALDGAKQPTNILFRPSDQNLWALWLAAEYAAATGDLAAFDEPLPYHPARAAEPVTLYEHLRRQFRFFVDVVGRGALNHVRILNADWNDLAIDDSGVPAADMIANGGSVLNSAMASWVLSVFAGFATRRGDTALAAEAQAQADELRSLVASAWNGQWFHRAYAPTGHPVGDTDCWLEVQPWALLCGAATADQARALLATLQQGQRANSPLGARLRWPIPQAQGATGTSGEGTLGGIWYSINMTLIWAASRIDADLAWDEWRRMSLAGHTSAYPEIWEGTLSGPDAWNAPESPRPGRTWAGTPPLVMQAFPVNNNHSHAQPLLAYLRLLGIEPTPTGSLAIGTGGSFKTPTFRLDADGHGRLKAKGNVILDTAHGQMRGNRGGVRW